MFVLNARNDKGGLRKFSKIPFSFASVERFPGSTLRHYRLLSAFEAILFVQRCRRAGIIASRFGRVVTTVRKGAC